MKTIYVICNSPEALFVLTSGMLNNLVNSDIFTCNNAYTFFRTSGRHLNFFTDTIDIMRHVKIPETLSKGYEKSVEFIYHRKGATAATGLCLFPGLKFSPVQGMGSSALNAIAYLVAVEDYEMIQLIGYTLDESQNPLWAYIQEKHDLSYSQKSPDIITFRKK